MGSQATFACRTRKTSRFVRILFLTPFQRGHRTLPRHHRHMEIQRHVPQRRQISRNNQLICRNIRTNTTSSSAAKVILTSLAGPVLRVRYAKKAFGQISDPAGKIFLSGGNDVAGTMLYHTGAEDHAR